jgi:hypothetical protein
MTLDYTPLGAKKFHSSILTLTPDTYSPAVSKGELVELKMGPFTRNR